MAPPVLSESANGFLQITLNRPRSGNLMTAAMIRSLTATIAAVQASDDIRTVVIRGKGRDFCLGRDPGKKAAGSTPPTAWQVHENVTGLILDSYAAMRHCPVPVLAVVQGHAQGFGSGIVGACDLAIAAHTARFSTPEMAAGIAPTLVMTALQDVNRKALGQLIYSGDAIDANTALAVGLVGEVVAEAELESRAQAFCERLASYDRAGIQVIKRFLGKPGRTDPETLSELADFTLATAFSRPR